MERRMRQVVYSIQEDQARLWFKNECNNKGFGEYNHDHRRRGRAVIINYKFSGMEQERIGSEEDVKRLTYTLGEILKFDVDVWDTKTLGGYNLLQKAKEEAEREDHKDSDCFLMVLMTHGGKNNLLVCNDDLVNFLDIVDCFKGDKCENLRNKPKIFIVQACRGFRYQKGVDVTSKSAAPALKPPTYLPVYSDIIIARSQYEGFISFRNPKRGSYFIQSLCDVLENDYEKPNGGKHDLLRLLTFTSNYVAKFDFELRTVPVRESNGVAMDEANFGESTAEATVVDALPFEPEQNVTRVEEKNIKQQPVVISTLLRLFFFYDKDPKKEA